MVVNTLETLLEDPQLEATGFWKIVEHPTEGTLRTTDIPTTYSETPGEIRRLPPRMGEHSVEVLREAGFSQEEIDGMLASGATRASDRRAPYHASGSAQGDRNVGEEGVLRRLPAVVPAYVAAEAASMGFVWNSATPSKASSTALVTSDSAIDAAPLNQREALSWSRARSISGRGGRELIAKVPTHLDDDADEIPDVLLAAAFIEQAAQASQALLEPVCIQRRRRRHGRRGQGGEEAAVAGRDHLDAVDRLKSTLAEEVALPAPDDLLRQIGGREVRQRRHEGDSDSQLTPEDPANQIRESALTRASARSHPVDHAANDRGRVAGQDLVRDALKAAEIPDGAGHPLTNVRRGVTLADEPAQISDPATATRRTDRAPEPPCPPG